jgi:transcriptional regulator NrdR family protein
MTCPVCGGDTKVIDSRPSEDSVQRRRKCLECDHRFNTIEIDKDFYDNIRFLGGETSG